MLPALYFKQEAFTSAGAKLMGRNVAGESFLRALLARCGDGPVTVQVDTRADADAFLAEAARWGSAVEPKFVASADPAALREAGVIFYSGPGLAEHAWTRAPFGATGWSLTGINHTTSSHHAMDAVVALVTAPVQPWDALICTSMAVRANIVTLIEGQQEYLRERLGAQGFPMPQLPVIPLGVHAADFESTADARARHRRDLGIGDDECVVLFVGRLSFHAKAHPVAMYAALERVAADHRIVMVEYGQYANDSIRAAFDRAAQALCPSVRRIVLDGRLPDKRDAAWAVGDVFCSLSDNLQEAFGITPVEAMAAGLPVVVSDWDGYRDTVRHGVDGFRIPTILPRAGLGADLALRFQLGLDNYDRYIGLASGFAAVDVEAVADAVRQLAASPELRARMGESGRRRARESYDWAAVLPRYEALWAEQAAIRAAAPAVPAVAPPARRDPFELFAAYPTIPLDETTPVALAMAEPGAAAAFLARIGGNPMFSFTADVLPDAGEVAALLAAAGAGPRPAADLVACAAPERRALALRGLAWLLKIGVLRVAGPLTL